MSKKNKYLSFTLIILLNVILKALYCNASPFSYDEIISVKDTLLDFGHIKHESEWDNNPPFYYYCLWVWHQFLPINELNARLLSILFVSGAIGLAFLFAQRYFNTLTAFFTAALLTLSNFITYYAQEARTYSLVLLLALISSLLFFSYVKKPKLATLLVLSLVNFLIVYSHYIAGIILLIQYLSIALFYRPRIKVYFSVQTALIVLLVFLRFTKKQFLNILNYNHKNDFWLKPAGFHDLINAISELFFNSLTALVFVIIFLAYAWELLKNKEVENYQVKWYCLMLGFFSVLFLYCLGTFKALFLPRYLIFSIPFAVMLVSDQLQRLKQAGFAVLAVLLIAELWQLNLKKNTGVDYRALAELVKTKKAADDYVIINTRDNLLLFDYYYNKTDFLKYSNVDSVCRTQNIYGVNSVDDIQNLSFKPGTKTFLLQSFHKINSSENPVQKFLSAQHKKIFAMENFYGTEFSLFINKASD